jgi:hypothetical protein
MLCGLAVAVTAMAAVVGGLQPRRCAGQQPATDEIDPTGGLRGKSPTAGKATGSTREELVRQWDLDRNGTIDPSEAAIARERMKRGRKEMQFNSGVDPITGRPRGETETHITTENEPRDPNPLDLPPEPVKRSKSEPALPGTRVPDAPDVSPEAASGSGPATGGMALPMPRSSAAVPGTTTPGPNTPRGAAADGSRRQSNGTAIPARPGTVTGGVRAGAPAARGGYGSLAPRSELNAGRPRGGLLPSLRPGQSMRPGAGRPGMTGGIPGMSPSVPTAPAPPTARPPRVSADEMGGF